MRPGAVPPALFPADPVVIDPRGGLVFAEPALPFPTEPLELAAPMPGDEEFWLRAGSELREDLTGKGYVYAEGRQVQWPIQAVSHFLRDLREEPFSPPGIDTKPPVGLNPGFLSSGGERPWWVVGRFNARKDCSIDRPLRKPVPQQFAPILPRVSSV